MAQLKKKYNQDISGKKNDAVGETWPPDFEIKEKDSQEALGSEMYQKYGK